MICYNFLFVWLETNIQNLEECSPKENEKKIGGILFNDLIQEPVAQNMG